jgi:glutamine amidotransferase PdxT
MSKNNTFDIKVSRNRIREFPSEDGGDSTTFYAFIKISDLPLDIPTKINPRLPHVGSKVARQIKETLHNTPKFFGLASRGLTIVAKEVSYDTQKEILSLTFDSRGNTTGLLDGGSNYAIIKESLEPFQDQAEQPAFYDKAYIRVEIITKIKDEVTELLSRSRNTSLAVQSYSLANSSGKFDFMKDALREEIFFKEIAWVENQRGKIPVLNVVSLITMFHPHWTDDTHPIISYSGRAKTLGFFLDPDNEQGFRNMADIMPDILRLYDMIIRDFPLWYNGVGGLSGLAGIEKEHRHNKFSARLGKLRAVVQAEEDSKFILDFTGEGVEYQIPRAWILPLLASLRNLVSYPASGFKWKRSPERFLEQHGPALAKVVLNWNKREEPNTLGKSLGFWAELYSKAHRLLTNPTDEPPEEKPEKPVVKEVVAA